MLQVKKARDWVEGTNGFLLGPVKSVGSSVHLLFYHPKVITPRLHAEGFNLYGVALHEFQVEPDGTVQPREPVELKVSTPWVRGDSDVYEPHHTQEVGNVIHAALLQKRIQPPAADAATSFIVNIFRQQHLLR